MVLAISGREPCPQDPCGANVPDSIGSVIRVEFSVTTTGVFLFAEPASPEPRFASALENRKEGPAQNLDPENYDPDAWNRFWSRANALLRYDHGELLRARPNDRGEIGDQGIPVLGYVEMLKKAGFESIDVLSRDSWNVVLAASKP